MMSSSTIATFQCETIKREYQFVGVSITANFPQAFPDAAINVSMQFAERIDEIKNALNKEVLYHPYMCNEIVAAYFACVEVEDLGDIPEGMIGFKLPLTEYAKVSCSNKTIGEGYSQLFAWMQEKGYKQKWFNYSMPIEIFYPDEQAEEERAEILLPIE